MRGPTPPDEREATRRRNLARLMRPRHVAVIGGAAADEAARQLDLIGFTGEVWPVNPRREQMQGRTCFRSIDDLPDAPDAAVVAVPAAACPEVFRALDARGAGGGICFAAGFAEDGVADLERELLDAAGDCALVGPNCHGIINCLDRVALWPDDHGAEPADAGFALISQSGNVALSATFQQRSAPFAYVIGTGNQAQLGIEDYIDVLLDDRRVKAIGLFIEGLRDIGRFARAAHRALEAGVPVVALKVGASEEGARASLSHTAALTGSDDVYQALFEQLGVRRAESLTELLETLKLLCISGPLPGRRVVSLSCSGGEAALMGDRLSAAGLECPAPGPDATAAIAERFRIPPTSVGNPLDYNTRIWGDAAASADAFEAVLSESYDAAILVLDFPQAERCRPDNWRAALDGFLAARARKPGAAAVLSTLPEALPEEARQACIEAGVTPLQGLDEGVRALAHAAAYALDGSRALEDDAWLGPLGRAPRGEVRGLDEADSKRRLAEYGVPVPTGRVTDAAGAVSAADALGYPVVVKAVSAALAHKTEAGAVALGLAGPEQVADAVASIGERLARSAAATAASQPGADTWLVETMVPDAVAELIVGVVRDAGAGPVLVLGSGGVLAELVRDTRTLLLPTTEGRIRRALKALSVGALLAGHRGRAAGDLQAAVTACMRVAAFAEAHADRLIELDINPLLVRPAGHGVVAADALLRLAPESSANN